MKNHRVKTESRPINKLKDHPQQAAIFGDLADAELDALVADMAAKGAVLQTHRQACPTARSSPATRGSAPPRSSAGRTSRSSSVTTWPRPAPRPARSCSSRTTWSAATSARWPRHGASAASSRSRAGDKAWGLNNVQKEATQDGDRPAAEPLAALGQPLPPGPEHSPHGAGRVRPWRNYFDHRGQGCLARREDAGAGRPAHPGW